MALGELKKLKEVNCVAVEIEKKAMEEEKFQEKLQKISEDAIAKAKGDTQGSFVSKFVENVKSNKNIYLIGGGILVLGVVSYFMFKKK
jgi:hypothetical protein